MYTLMYTLIMNFPLLQQSHSPLESVHIMLAEEDQEQDVEETWLLDYWAELEATAEQTQRAIDNWIARETTTTKRNRY